jgi:glutathione S-transferase
MRLFDFERSHNCYKVRLFLSILQVQYERQTIDLMNGENRTPEFLQMNPRGQVPVLQAGDKYIWDSTAILLYLARQYGGTLWLPEDALGISEIGQWLAVAQNELLYGIGRAHWLRRGGSGDRQEATRRGERGLNVLNNALERSEWLALQRPTIADIACYPHASLAHQAGMPLDDYPHVRKWCTAVERIPGYVSIDGESTSAREPK